MSTNQPAFDASRLIPGRIYQVKVPFLDYDSNLHPVGERWSFIKNSFLPYEDGLTTWIEMDGRQSSFRLQWREETQGAIIDHFSDYVEAL